MIHHIPCAGTSPGDEPAIVADPGEFAIRADTKSRADAVGEMLGESDDYLPERPDPPPETVGKDRLVFDRRLPAWDWDFGPIFLAERCC